MWGALRFLILIGLLAAAAFWFADNPGAVQLEWQGYLIETSVGVLFGAVAIVAAAAALIYRFWLALRRAPAAIAKRSQENKRERGYKALTQGMVAVAAGDAAQARKLSKKADVLLNEPPLTLLLAAQSAQLDGDEKAAERFFRAMLERPETKFLGLRGLFNQAIKRGDRGQALTWAKQAKQMEPAAEWVATSLVQLQTETGQWSGALASLEDAQRRRHYEGDAAKRNKAVLTHQVGLETAELGNLPDAIRHAKRACDLAPDFIPAIHQLASLYIQSGKARKAASVLESAWARHPHPDFVALYCAAKGADDPLSKVKAVDRLAAQNKDHPESHLALARAALDAKLWGESRGHLVAVNSAHPSKRVCRMMAELEESEHGDLASARSWLVRSQGAEADPAWVCETCGNAVEAWTATCGNCGEFDGFRWRRPTHVAAAPAALPSASNAPALPVAD